MAVHQECGRAIRRSRISRSFLLANKKYARRAHSKEASGAAWALSTGLRLFSRSNVAGAEFLSTAGGVPDGVRARSVLDSGVFIPSLKEQTPWEPISQQSP